MICVRSGLSYDILPNLTDGRPNPVAEAYGAVQTANSLEEVANIVAGIPLVAQPGTTWNYSMGIDIMGRCIEVLSASFSRHSERLSDLACFCNEADRVRGVKFRHE